MKSLLGHGEANGITPLLCALERDHAEWKTRDTECEMRVFVQRSGARSMDLVCRGMASPGSRNSIVLKCVSQFHSSLARSLLRGLCDALRHCAVLLFGLLSQSESGPLLQNARLGAWESRPLPPHHTQIVCWGPRHLA
jgi:hypothetical protein